MACLKGLIEFVLTHVRLTLQADVPFDANEIGASIFMRIEPSGLIGSRTPSLTTRAQLVASQQPRHGRLSTHRDLCSHVARFSCRRDPRASGPNLERLEPLARVLSSALYQPGHLVWVWFGPI